MVKLLNLHWECFQEIHHDLCKAKSEAGKRCLFCLLTSCCLRVNRLKYRRCIKLIELESQKDILMEITLISSADTQDVSRIVNTITTDANYFGSVFLSNEIKCKSCKKNFSISEFKHIFIKNEDMKPNKTVEDCLKDKINRAHEDNSDCKNLQVNIENKSLLFVTFESYTEIELLTNFFKMNMK